MTFLLAGILIAQQVISFRMLSTRHTAVFDCYLDDA